MQPRFLQRDINATLNASEFETVTAGRDTVMGGIRDAGSNLETAHLVMDGDLDTYWEPVRGDSLENWFVDINLGRTVIARLSLGWQRLHLISGDGQTRSFYALATWDRALVGGRLRLFEFGALVKDNIRDDLQHWVQPIGAIGRMQDLQDVLPARNTWKNTLYLDLDQRLSDGLRLQHRFKWDLLRQRDNRTTLRLREGRKTSGFIGLIDKVEWSIPIGLAILEPRLKSEFRRDRPFSTRRPTATSLEETAILMWIQPILAEQTSVNYYPRYGRQIFSTTLQTGIEFTRFWMLQGRREEIDQDFRDWTLIAQLTNRVAYTGYQMVFRAGARWNRRHFAEGENQRATSLFMSVHAGLE